MTEFHTRCVAFENDHTYLKTTYNDRENVQFLQTKMSTIGSQNNLVVKKYNIEKKLNTELIQPKITNFTEIVSTSPTQSNVLLVPFVNVPLSVNPENITQKKTLIKCKVPDVPQEKFVVKPIKPVKNKIVKDYENGVCTIKLSSNLLKRIQSGEKLFMCMQCDKIYTEHKDLLEHQIIHDKFHNNVFNYEKGDRVFTNSVQNIKVVEHEKVTFDDDNRTKQSKSLFKSSLNPKKRKIVFQGECIMCHSVYPDLGKHLITVHQNVLNKHKFNHLKYHCHKCDMEFNIKQQLLAHELSAHKNIHTFNCELCSKGFSHRESLETHIESHYSDGMKYLCPYCDVGFPHSNGLRTHLVKHIGFNNHENTTYELLTSPIEYSPTRSPEHLDQLFTELHHISEDTNEVFVEQVADDNYRVRFSMNHEEKLDNTDNASSPLDSLLNKSPNINIDLNDEQFVDNDKILSNPKQTTSLNNKNRISYTVCRICMVIVSYSRIGKHMKKKHNNAAPYQCEICHAEFNRKHIMDDHRRKHINNKPHKCTECSKCFTYKHHLNRHMMIVHNADSLEKPFKCSVCDKAFSFKEYLTLHVNSRHKGKHYMCQICGKSFSTNAALNKHQLCHTDERPFMCEHCGRTFKCKTHCDTHTKNMHPGDPLLALPPEKFECDLCNKKFSTKVYRDMHYKRHNGQGHQCNICYKLFVSKAHMQRHIKIMHQN